MHEWLPVWFSLCLLPFRLCVLGCWLSSESARSSLVVHPAVLTSVSIGFIRYSNCIFGDCWLLRTFFHASLSMLTLAERKRRGGLFSCLRNEKNISKWDSRSSNRNSVKSMSRNADVFALNLPDWLCNPKWFFSSLWALHCNFHGPTRPCGAVERRFGCSLNCWSWTNKLILTAATDFYSFAHAGPSCRTHKRHRRRSRPFSFVRCTTIVDCVAYEKVSQDVLKMLSLTLRLTMTPTHMQLRVLSGAKNSWKVLPSPSLWTFFGSSNWKKNLNQNWVNRWDFVFWQSSQTHTRGGTRFFM